MIKFCQSFSDSDANNQPPRRQSIERNGFPRKLPGSASGQRCHHKTDTNVLGTHRDRGQCNPGIYHGHDTPVPGDVVPEEKPIPARLLCGSSQFSQYRSISARSEIDDIDGIFHALNPSALVGATGTQSAQTVLIFSPFTSRTTNFRPAWVFAVNHRHSSCK